MKITDVKSTTLKGFKQWNYVLIETDEGLTGLGIELNEEVAREHLTPGYGYFDE